MRIAYSLSNYRCFPDSSSASIIIEPGFTSFIGLNNAGKSTLLRSLYELRGLFGNLASFSVAWTSGSHQPGQLQTLSVHDVADPDEIFTDGNPRDLQIEVGIQEQVSQTGLPVARRVRFTVDRTSKTYVVDISPSGDDTDLVRTGAWQMHGDIQVLELANGDRCEVTPFFEVFATLANTLYLGAFRNALNIGAGGTYYDLTVGQNFISTWNGFKTGPSKRSREAARRIERDLGRIFRLEDLDVSASQDGRTLIVSIGDQSYTLQELGAGFVQFVIVLAYVATRQPALILIDEPELNLHPALQVDFLNTLGGLCSFATLFATHQLGLARAASDRIYTVHRIRQGEAAVRPFEGTPHLGELLGELNFSGYQELGYDAVLLVEGPTELRTVQRLLRLYRADHKVVLLPMAGGQLIKRDVRPELQEIKRLTSRVFALVDSERGEAGAEVDGNRAGFVAACEAEAIECHLLERRAIENYFSDRAVKAAKGPSWRALGEYERPKDGEMPWSKVRDNWRIASEMLASELDKTDLGAFLERIVAAAGG